MTVYEEQSLALLSAIAAGISNLVGRSVPIRSDEQREVDLQYQKSVTKILQNVEEATRKQ